QHFQVVEGNESNDEDSDAQRGDDADRKPVAGKQRRANSRPSIGGVTIVAHLGEILRHIDVKFMRWRKLAVDVTGPARMTEIGQIIEVAIAEGAPHFHRWKHSTKTFAITARIAHR